MVMNRRLFLSTPLGLPALAAASDRVTPEYEDPLFDLHKVSSSPVKIASIDLLRVKSNWFVRVTSTDGASGISRTKQVEDFVPMLLNRIVPFFTGKDAREIERLIDEVYIFESNYKLAGLPFWAPVAYVEQAIFDLLGKVAKKPVGELLGGVKRREIAVYLSGSGRETTAEEEVAVYARGVEFTGAKAVKFKIGGRMSRNKDVYPGRTETMMKLARKTLGDNVIIYTDANGSYNAAKGIEIGKMLQELKCGFFEEPCPWEEVSETKKVADALTMPVAAGEQDSSLWKFQWMLETGVMQIVQPDLNYNGGFIRAARVARMARKLGIPIVPHNTQTGASAVNILHFASAIPNIGPYMEFPWRAPEKPDPWYSPQFAVRNGVVKVPTGAGLGLEIDPRYLSAAAKVSS
jgi:L-alanine-DL-glutamate epimerase-like enolase superfamily enzyme